MSGIEITKTEYLSYWDKLGCRSCLVLVVASVQDCPS